MAGIEVSPTALRGQMNAWLSECMDEALRRTEEVALVAATAAEDRVRETIDTTPSALSRVPKGNRNWTYHMRNRVDAKVTRTGTSITIQIGWMNVKGDEQYIGIQEYGGTVRGRDVPPMGALTAGRSEAIRILKNAGIL